MPLQDWRGTPVIPAAWLTGYRRVYPMMTQAAPVGGQRQRNRAARLERALHALTDDGRPAEKYRY